jgi:hypothetical protein
MALTQSPLRDHHPQLIDLLFWMENVLDTNPEFFRQAIRDWSADSNRPRIIPASGKHRPMTELVKRVLLAAVYDCLVEPGFPRFSPWADDPIGAELPYAVALVGVIGSQGFNEIQLRYVLEAFHDVRAEFDRQPSGASPATGFEVQQEAVATNPELAEFVFRPDGDGYFLRGFGEEGHVTATGAKGLHDIFLLVQSADGLVPMIELDAGPGARRLAGDLQTKQPIANRQTRDDITTKRRGLQADIASADTELERSELQAELEKLEAEAAKMFGLNGKSRDLNNPINRLRPTLLKRKKTACNLLRNRNLTELGDHFDLAIGSEGSCLAYRPEIKNIVWDTTKKSVARQVTK